MFVTKLCHNADLFVLARRTLLTQFLQSSDPNLAILGLEIFGTMLEALLSMSSAAEAASKTDLMTLDERTTVVLLFNHRDRCI